MRLLIAEDEKNLNRVLEKQLTAAGYSVDASSRNVLFVLSDRGTLSLSLEAVNMSELAELIVEEQRENASRKGITLRTDIQPDITVTADETMMMRLWINLISNAIQYGREGGFAEIGLSSSNHEIRGYVKDNGIGISSEHLPKIWNRFFQADPSRSSKDEGSMGLGLPMVRWIVEAHGGKIQAESIPGEGSIFTFFLPF